MLLMTMTIVPRANQACAAATTTQMRAAGLTAPPATFGASEWTAVDLVERARGTSPDRAAAWRQINGRLASSTMPIMIGFVALGISGYTRKIAIFSATWVLMLYIAALRSAASSNYRPPSLESVWMVNAIFALAGLWLVWIRPRPDDSGSESRLPMP
jgi:lipopolysaccharide export LptBFGC system permease protein LptF